MKHLEQIHRAREARIEELEADRVATMRALDRFRGCDWFPIHYAPARAIDALGRRIREPAGKAA
jgi:hypothetical protein